MSGICIIYIIYAQCALHMLQKENNLRLPCNRSQTHKQNARIVRCGRCCRLSRVVLRHSRLTSTCSHLPCINPFLRSPTLVHSLSTPVLFLRRPSYSLSQRCAVRLTAANRSLSTATPITFVRTHTQPQSAGKCSFVVFIEHVRLH